MDEFDRGEFLGIPTTIVILTLFWDHVRVMRSIGDLELNLNVHNIFNTPKFGFRLNFMTLTFVTIF